MESQKRQMFIGFSAELGMYRTSDVELEVTKDFGKQIKNIKLMSNTYFMFYSSCKHFKFFQILSMFPLQTKQFMKYCAKSVVNTAFE